ncbi:RimK family alpha-L-glutamate ligase [Chromobacterium subtsugae]|uniref:RimK family alpha-L-glutamate ligase n=1 Tax=Chromobacterium subtsugae TaxID=251747 RepID=UPI0007F8AECD|nr:RimK family alpha-L-glutamate ligase [Chromobacterium subtsugae]
MSQITVLLILTKMRPEEKAIVEALERRGVKVIVSVDGRDLGWLLQGESGVGHPQVAMLRCLSQSRNVELARLLRACGIPTINSVDAIDICCSKVAQAMLFRQYDIPAPQSVIAFQADEITRYGQRHGFHFVLKPASSSWGRGVTLIRDEEALEAWRSAWETHDALYKHFPVLIQAFVEKPGYDLRVVIVGERPIVAFRRATDHWKTNTHLGAQVVPCEVTDAIHDLTTQVVEAIGPGIYGLDIFEQVGSDELLVCEINQNPEFWRSSQIHQVDVAGAIADWVAADAATYNLSFQVNSATSLAMVAS